MRVLLSGGGTAGHIYPALTVAARLSADGHDEVAFVGTPDGLEARLVPEAGVAFFALPARGLRPVAPAVAARRRVAVIALVDACGRGACSAGGGRTSSSASAATCRCRSGSRRSLRGVPLVLHEQNSVPGLANKVLSRWARAVGVTYEGSIGVAAASRARAS